ncbi:unnamed protein product, partial [Prorocentrum cordatum]
ASRAPSWTPRGSGEGAVSCLRRASHVGATHNPAHEALAAASQWLSSDARDRKRARRLKQQLSLTARGIRPRDPAAHVDAPLPVVGSAAGLPQAAWSPSSPRAAASHRDTMAATVPGLPLSAARESPSVVAPAVKETPPVIRELCERIAEKAIQKFKTTREAFRFIDADHDGFIDRSEMRHFFRAYDYGPDVADSLFDYLDQEGNEEIDHNTFFRLLTPFFNGCRPASTASITMMSPPSPRESPRPSPEVGEPTGQKVRRSRTKDVQKEFDEVLDVIGKKAAFKFKTVHEAWRYVDNDKNGAVSRSEMQYFFRAFNLTKEAADKFFDRLDDDEHGEIPYEVFTKHLAPYIQPQVCGGVRLPVKVHAKGALSRTMPTGFKDELAASPASPMKRRQGADQGLRAELKALMQDLGQKLPLKFRHPRDAFRMLDLQRNGRITRQELRAFFRGFGHSDQVSDKMFDLLAEESHGEVDFCAFMSHFDSVLGPHFRCAKRKPLIELEDKRLEKEINDIAMAIQDRLTTKYKTVQDAFRAMDLNKDGTVQLSELKIFFRSFGMPTDVAEKVFNVLCSDGGMDEDGGVKYEEFTQLLGAEKPKERSKGTPSWRLNYGGVALVV